MALNFGALGFSLLSGGLDIFNQYNQSNTQLKQARRRVAHENAMAQASRNFQNLQIKRSNEYQRQAFETQKGIDIGAEQSMRDTAAQQHSADLQAWSQVAIAPYMQSELPPAVSAPMPRGMSGLSQGLMIGGAVLGGLGTYNSMAPTGSKLWGANLPNARTRTS
jgi:hypothetical protein